MEQIKYIDLIQQSSAYRTLSRDVTGGRMSHAYLLVSSDDRAITLLTKLFLCLAVGNDHREAVMEGTFADVIELPEEGDKVSVKDINYLTQTANVTPTESDKKFYVINHGETMNEAAQNKLLKTLEEPPAVTCVIIKTATQAKMLPTVVSRCRTIVLQPFAAHAIEAELKKHYPENEKTFLAVSACRGSISKAESILGDETYLKVFRLAQDVLLNLERSTGCAAYAAKLYDYREYLRDIIDFMEIILRDAMCIDCGSVTASAEGGFKQETIKIAERYPASAALKEFQVLNRAKRRIELNGNVNSIIDELLFSILEVRAKWK